MAKRRLTVGSKAFMEAVDAEITRRALAKPIMVRTLLVDFKARTVNFDGGRQYGPIASEVFAIPIVPTDHRFGTRCGDGMSTGERDAG